VEDLAFKVILLLAITAPLLLSCLLYDFYRGLAYVVMGLAFSTVSLVVYYNRLEFLAAESVHGGLLAVTAGYIIEHYIGGNLYFYAPLIGLVIVYTTMILVKRGLQQEKATAITTSLTLVLTVILVHYAITRIPAKYSLSSLILGDPLLVSTREAVFASVISVVLTLIVLLVYRGVIEVSIDEVSAQLAGLNVGFYSILSYTLVGLTSIVFLKFAGYIAEHVMLLLPASLAALYSNNVREHLWLVLVFGLFSSTLGFVLAVLLGGVPAGFTGLVLILLLVIKYAGVV
jgi:zinc/manganese transport system permease protein